MARAKKEQAKKPARKVSVLPAKSPAINLPAINLNFSIEAQILSGEECREVVKGVEINSLNLVYKIKVNDCSPDFLSFYIKNKRPSDGISERSKTAIKQTWDYLSRHIESAIADTIDDLIFESAVAFDEDKSADEKLAGIREIASRAYGDRHTKEGPESFLHERIASRAVDIEHRVMGYRKGFTSDKSAQKIRLNPAQLNSIDVMFRDSYDSCAQVRYETTEETQRIVIRDEVILEAIKAPHPKDDANPWRYDLPTIALVYAARRAGVLEATMKQAESIRRQLNAAGIETKKPVRKKSNK